MALGSSPYQTGEMVLMTVELRDFFKCALSSLDQENRKRWLNKEVETTELGDPTHINCCS